MRILGASGDWQKCGAGRIGAELKRGHNSRRQHASCRSKTGAHARATDIAIRRAEQGERIASVKMKRLRRELGLDHHARVWGKPLQIRMPKRAPEAIEKTGVARSSNPKRQLPTYNKSLRDGRGRIAVFMRVRYMGFKSPKWSAGCAAEHVTYILRDEALHTDSGSDGWFSNMGANVAEISDAWKVIEEVEKGYRSNAIVQHRIVVNLPHQLTAADQAKLVEAFCERTLGRLGLPYVAAIHRPDAEGDKRNFHAHICFSTRPVARVAPFEWSIAQEKVNQLTDADGLKVMRAQFTAVTNFALRKADLEERYTHQSYSARGIDAQRTEHLGPARAAVYRNGRSVDLASRNALVINRNEAVEDVCIARQRCNFAERREALLEQLAKLRISASHLAAMRTIAQTLSAATQTHKGRPPFTPQLGEMLTTQHALVLAIQLRSKTAQSAIERACRADPLSQELMAKKEQAEALQRKAAVARQSEMQAQASALISERLRILRLQIAITAQRARSKGKKANTLNYAPHGIQQVPPRDIEQNGIG